jgi:hypothetical protein
MCANPFMLNPTAYWNMANGFRIFWLTWSGVDYGQECSSQPPLYMMNNNNPKYKVEAILEQAHTSAQILQYNVKWFGYSEPD